MHNPKRGAHTGEVIDQSQNSKPSSIDDLPPSDGAKSRLGIADLKEGNHAAEEAFG